MIGRPRRSTLFPSTTLFRSPDSRAYEEARPSLRDSDEVVPGEVLGVVERAGRGRCGRLEDRRGVPADRAQPARDRKSTRLNSSHTVSSYAVVCLENKSNALN